MQNRLTGLAAALSGAAAHVWNNTGDTAYLRNAAGTTIDTCSWGSSGSHTYC